jgi:hypothetical protein
MRRVAGTIVLMLVLAVGTACSKQGATVSELAHRGAEFRDVARGTYENLIQESCEGKPALRRAVVLAPEIAAMRAFEAEMRSAPAGAQLALALSDIEYRKATGTLGCWNDSDPRFARRHVEMSREGAIEGLKRLRQLGPHQPPLPELGGLDPPRAAAFRALVRDLAAYLEGRCQHTRLGGNDAILAPARMEFDRLRRRFASGPHALQFAVAEADTRYATSQTMVECADPGSEPPEALSRVYLEQTRERAARIIAAAQ